ncbi:MAG: hypothetical protein IPH80_34170, partial [Myxococcales bacterium]|nr:hypothetical protein [Myxococcales bacterium]
MRRRDHGGREGVANPWPRRSRRPYNRPAPRNQGAPWSIARPDRDQVPRDDLDLAPARCFMSRDRTSNPDRAGAGGHAAGAHDQADPLQQARSAVELAEGFGLMPGVVVAAEQAIADRSYSAALAATRAWLMQKPHLELLARSMDPQDAFVPRAQALLDRMRALEPKLPRNIFKVGIAELDREDEAEWLAQFGAKPKGQGNASTYADVHGTVDASVGLGPDASVNVGRTSGPNLDLSPGDIAKGVLVPPWALSKPVRRRVLG